MRRQIRSTRGPWRLDEHHERGLLAAFRESFQQNRITRTARPWICHGSQVNWSLYLIMLENCRDQMQDSRNFTQISTRWIWKGSFINGEGYCKSLGMRYLLQRVLGDHRDVARIDQVVRSTAIPVRPRLATGRYNFTKATLPGNRTRSRLPGTGAGRSVAHRDRSQASSVLAYQGDGSCLFGTSSASPPALDEIIVPRTGARSQPGWNQIAKYPTAKARGL